MSRLRAGTMVGLAAGVLTVILGFFGPLAFDASLVLALAGGIVTGYLIARNPLYSGKMLQSGALGGLMVGLLVLIGQIAAGAIYVSTNAAFKQSITTSVRPTFVALATATATAGGKGPAVDATLSSGVLAYGIGTGCITGIFSLALAVVAGLATAFIIGRNLPPASPPMAEIPESNPMSL